MLIQPRKQRVKIEETYTRAYFCKRCGAKGHNRRSCKEPIDDCRPPTSEQETEQGNDFPVTPEKERDFSGTSKQDNGGNDTPEEEMNFSGTPEEEMELTDVSEDDNDVSDNLDDVIEPGDFDKVFWVSTSNLVLHNVEKWCFKNMDEYIEFVLFEYG
ncbi:hypothetical protein AMTR_s00112p00048590 [Amborella trichopoda]|uniref:CCHC-type domain-containing protein n=1 Tax=Amborella trichopoda TaxID=13333 RepID=W1NXN5_AMBTC|nr:hypothetical protein AMTR_s00112p00048590 [Amborella trichopoda]